MNTQYKCKNYNKNKHQCITNSLWFQIYSFKAHNYFLRPLHFYSENFHSKKKKIITVSKTCNADISKVHALIRTAEPTQLSYFPKTKQKK